MFERLLILTKLQLSNIVKLRIDQKGRFYGQVALRVLVVVLMSIVMTFALYFISNFLYIPVNHHFIIFVLILTQGMGIISATSGLMNDLYHSKDNQILLSLPANNNEIYISKLMVFYINEFLKNLYVLAPILIAFGIENDIMFLYYINIVPMLILLPLLVVLIASLLSMPAVYLRNFLKNRRLLSLIFLLVFIGLLFYGVILILAYIPYPIRIVQLYNRFMISITMFMQASARYGLIYTVVGELLYGIKPFINYLILLLVIGGLSLMTVLISRPLFFRLTSSSSEQARIKPHKHENKASKHVFVTFLRKELTVNLRSMNELLDNYAILLSLPFFMVILNHIYMGMNRSTFGNQLVLVFNVMIVLLLVMAANTASATAISTEGGEFALLKTAPSDTARMAWAKIAFNLAFSILVIMVSFILFRMVMPFFSAADTWRLFLFVILVNSGHILWSFQIDVMHPKIREYASTGSLSGNKNISASVRIGFVIALLFSAFSALSFVYLEEIAWLLMISAAVLFLVFRFFLFRSFLNAYFRDIEL
ncbi:MAG: hypothetical protein K9K93_03895 [Acholeplasmataceae bacterium]|nr:hypothetical protein [Acholeplasmataceae bacterium]